MVKHDRTEFAEASIRSSTIFFSSATVFDTVQDSYHCDYFIKKLKASLNQLRRHF